MGDRTLRARVVEIPSGGTYTLANARVPAGCLITSHDESAPYEMCIDRLVSVDIEVQGGTVVGVKPATSACSKSKNLLPHLMSQRPTIVDLKGKMVFPTFVDLHTHIDKSHTTERSRNPDGSLSGADRSTAADAAFWDEDDVFRRMNFSVACAYAHGTSALRTHLINMTPKQTQLTWPAFAKLKKAWAGRVELQAVSLVALSYFRDEEASKRLADTVASYGGLLGAAVCCAERGGFPDDDWTTCEKDRDELLDRIFTLAKERDLNIDFHTDENGNELARGLRHVAQKTVQHGYQGRVVCGHCWYVGLKSLSCN